MFEWAFIKMRLLWPCGCRFLSLILSKPTHLLPRDPLKRVRPAQEPPAEARQPAAAAALLLCCDRWAFGQLCGGKWISQVHMCGGSVSGRLFWGWVDTRPPPRCRVLARPYMYTHAHKYLPKGTTRRPPRPRRRRWPHPAGGRGRGAGPGSGARGAGGAAGAPWWLWLGALPACVVAGRGGWCQQGCVDRPIQ